MSRHNVWIPDPLWKRAERAALKASLKSGERISVAELVRRGLEEQVDRIEKPGKGDR